MNWYIRMYTSSFFIEGFENMFIENKKLYAMVILLALFGAIKAADRETINPLHALTKRVEAIEEQAIEDFRELSARHTEVFNMASRAKGDVFVAGRAIDALQKQIGDKVSGTVDIETRLALLEFRFGHKIEMLERTIKELETKKK